MKLDLSTLKSLLEQGFITKEAYEQLVSEDDTLKLQAEEGGFNEKVPLRKVIQQYVTYLNNEFASNTADGYYTNLRNFMEFFYEVDNFSKIDHGVMFKDIPLKAIERWFLKLASTGYSATSIRRFKHSMKKFLEYLSTTYNIKVVDIDKIELPNVDDDDKSTIDALTDEEIRGIAHHATSARNKSMILLMYEAGMKRQELIDCKKDEHIDFDKRLVKIVNPDGSVDRIGKFSEGTKRVIEEYLAEWELELKEINENRWQKSRESGKKYDPVVDSEYLFQTIRSPQISYATIVRALKEASFEYFLNKYSSEGASESEAKLMAEERSSNINTETLRHSLRAFLFSEGKDLQTIQAIMGDENRHKVRRYLKVAQRLYPEKFLD